MFSSAEFLKWSGRGAVCFVAVETRIEGRTKDTLLQHYQLGGFPSLIVLDAEGDVLCRDVDLTVPSIQATAQCATDYQELAPLVQAGKSVDPGRWFLARLGTKRLSWTAAEAELGNAQLSPAQHGQAKPLLFTLEVHDLREKLTGKAWTRDQVADRVHQLYRDGSSPPQGSLLLPFFESMLLTGAMRAKDAAAFGAAYPQVRQRLEHQIAMLEGSTKADSEFVKSILEQNRKSLAALLKQEAIVAAGFDKNE